MVPLLLLLLLLLLLPLLLSCLHQSIPPTPRVSPHLSLA